MQKKPKTSSDTADKNTIKAANAPAPIKKKKHDFVQSGLILLAVGLIATSLLMDEPKPELDAKEIQEIKASFKADGTEARETIAKIRETGEDNNLQAAFDLGNTYEADNEPVNAYLMYFFAAKKGHAESAMKLARLADPVNSESSSPQPYQAYKWYKAAADSGIQGAKEHLEKLKEWAQASARDGNQRAQRLLLQWQS